MCAHATPYQTCLGRTMFAPTVMHLPICLMRCTGVGAPCGVPCIISIYRVEQHKVNCPKGRRNHPGVPRRATHLHIASPQGQFLIFYSQLLLRIRKKHRFRGAFSLSIKSIYRFYFSCGSTHKIEFAQQIHNSRGRGPGHSLLPLCGNSPCVPRELYKGRKIVPVGRGFSSRFD